MKIANKEEILDHYRFENFNIGDYLLMLNESLTDGNIIVKTGEHKAINVDTGDICLIEPYMLFIKIEQQLIFQPSVEELTAISMQKIHEAEEENKDIAIYDWERITNKSKKLEEEGLKETKEELETGFKVDQYKDGPYMYTVVSIEDVPKKEKEEEIPIYDQLHYHDTH